MKRLLFIFLLLSALRCFGAVGDVTGAFIETNGWASQWFFSGLNTNGNFFNGLGTNNSLTSTNAALFTFTDMGFNSAGNAIQVTQSCVSSRIIRLAYPLMNTNDIQPDGSGGCISRIADTAYITSSTSNITLTATAGAYAVTNGNGTNCNAVTGLTVTNSSLLPYPRCIANWTKESISWIRYTNNTAHEGVVAFHASAHDGKMVEAVRLVLQDQHSHAVTSWVTSASAYYEPVSKQWVCKYLADIDISSFTQGDAVRKDFTIYPRVGDTNAVLDTFDNVNIQPTALYASRTNLCDRSGAYGVTVAVVDPVNGTSSGVATTNFNSVSPPATFANINQAAVAIKNTNAILFARSNLGAGIIYLTNGNHAWTGASSTVGTNSETWVMLTPFPGSDRSSCIITGQNGGQNLSQKVRLNNLSITATTAAGCFASMENLWLDTCYIESASGLPVYTVTNQFWTDCTISNLNNGIKPFSNTKAMPTLVEGNIIRSLGNYIFCYTVIGNLRDITNEMSANFLASEYNLMTIPPANGMIFAFNSLYGCRYAGGSLLTLMQNTNQPLGAAIVQNVAEWISTGNQVILGIANDSSLATGITNVLMWNNTFVGQRANLAYNESGTAPIYRVQWQCRNNCFDDNNIKTDTFDVPTPSGNRVGNWSAMFGVSDSGNFYGNVNNIGTAAFSHAGVGSGTKMADGFCGTNSFETPETALALAYQQFVSRKSYDGAANGPGLGDYRLRSSSPLRVNIGCDIVVPFDANGVARTSENSVPGAYVFYGGGPSLMTGNGRLTGGASLK